MIFLGLVSFVAISYNDDDHDDWKVWDWLPIVFFVSYGAMETRKVIYYKIGT